MRIETARELKAELLSQAVGELTAHPETAPGTKPGVTAGSAGGRPGTPPALIALGLTLLAGGRYGLAVRYRLGTSRVRSLARRLAERARREGGDAVDVRRTGRLRPLVAPARRVGPILGERGRVRPLRPGVSIAHLEVTAGTLGAFVVLRTASPGGPPVHALSNSHVLAGAGSAGPGDVIVQPGPADGGRYPDDRVGVLAAAVPLTEETPNIVDAAVALLDDPDVDLRYPAGLLTGTSAVGGDELVEKVGRTSGRTRGRITAIEVDDVVVDYARTGALRFDGQIEISGATDGPHAGPFSRGGDSGSVVYLPGARLAVGLVFAGSETGGDDGAGLTYLNPIGPVLDTLGADLVT